MSKVYFFGFRDGAAIKIGFTSGALIKRKNQILAGQLSKVDLILLAAVNGTSTHEGAIKDYFSNLRMAHNSTETFEAKPELVEYINWLRQQWWVYLEAEDLVDHIPAWPEWMPAPDRRVPFMEEDPQVNGMIPVHRSYSGPLAGTPWDRFCTPQRVGDDFYTPANLVNAAKEAMGGIDLDPASHWLANRVHRIPNFYHIHRCGKENPWFGRVWFNPPYGNNAPWFAQIIRYWDSKDIKQLCMVSPVWAFTTQQAKPIIARSSAMVLLTPTPQFWGNPSGGTGSNHPHAIVYLGDRINEFHRAFRDFGAPFRLLQADDNLREAAE